MSIRHMPADAPSIPEESSEVHTCSHGWSQSLTARAEGTCVRQWWHHSFPSFPTLYGWDQTFSQLGVTGSERSHICPDWWNMTLLGQPLGFSQCCRTQATLTVNVEKQNKMPSQDNTHVITARKSSKGIPKMTTQTRRLVWWTHEL